MLLRPCRLLLGPFIAAALVFADASAQIDDSWSLRKQDEGLGIDVYQRDGPEGRPEFLAVTRVQSRLAPLVALLHDVERMSEWMHRVEDVRVLEQIGPTENITYTVYDMPWPFRDRDSVLRVTLEQDPESLVVSVHAESEPGHPPSEERVRMRDIESLWELEPLPDGETEVRLRGHGDPGGRLSSGVMRVIQNRLIWQSPLETLTRLHEVADEPRYQDAAFDFIQELEPRQSRPADPGRPAR